MNKTTDINPHIIEGLYTEALLLADEVRAAFDMSGRLDELAGDEDLARIALSCEALRTTTRMMHAIAWRHARCSLACRGNGAYATHTVKNSTNGSRPIRLLFRTI